MAAGMVCLLAIGSSTAFAQGDTPRLEVGGQVNVLRLSESSDTNAGFGGRVTVNLSRWLGLEGEYQFLPQDTMSVTSVQGDGSRVGIRYDRRRSTALPRQLGSAFGPTARLVRRYAAATQGVGDAARCAQPSRGTRLASGRRRAIVARRFSRCRCRVGISLPPRRRCAAATDARAARGCGCRARAAAAHPFR